MSKKLVPETRKAVMDIITTGNGKYCHNSCPFLKDGKCHGFHFKHANGVITIWTLSLKKKGRELKEPLYFRGFACEESERIMREIYVYSASLAQTVTAGVKKINLNQSDAEFSE